MKILHYALGFPPLRTGGLTKYCIDLMLTQKEQGHNVALLWPGGIGFFEKKLKIRRKDNWENIISFEILNPLPVSLDEGILKITKFTKWVDPKPFKEFLSCFAPDVIHIHTLMGLHSEFVCIAKELGIRTIFTSHDYFGICARVTLFRDGKTCDNDHDCLDCVKCNRNALSMNKILIMQSSLYRLVKNTTIIKQLRHLHRNKFFKHELSYEQFLDDTVEEKASDYRYLRDYYLSILRKIDTIHFNSSVSESIYSRYFKSKDGKIIPIFHRDIVDHRKAKDFSNKILRLTYLGPAKRFKGFFFLLDELDKLWQQGVQDFELHIYTITNEHRPYMLFQQNGYTYSQLIEIFDNTDLLLAPSLWYETFGFTVLEGISHGVPVLVSDKVGAKDIVETINRDLVIPMSKGCIGDVIAQLCNDRKPLTDTNQAILHSVGDLSMLLHSGDMLSLYNLK